jgi:hypothetical protein
MSSTLLCREESESEWIKHALKNNNNIKIYSHNNINKVVIIRTLKGTGTKLDFIKYDSTIKNALMKACNNLARDYPDETMELKRDYELIKNGTSLYITGYFDVTNRSRLQIKGFEAWIVEMFVNKFPNNLLFYPVYLFSEDIGTWCQLNNNFKWIRIARPPKPSGMYIGISSAPKSNISKLEVNLL